MFLFLPFPGWQDMVGFLVSGMVLSYAMGPISLLCLRLDMPQKRLFRMPAANVLCLLAFYFCNLINYWTGWEIMWKLAIAMLIGLAFFIYGVLTNKIAKENLGLKSAVWLVPYFGGLVLISYLGAFGGLNVIPFGWDFLVIGLFSIVILYLAVKNRAGASEADFVALQTRPMLAL